MRRWTIYALAILPACHGLPLAEPPSDQRAHLTVTDPRADGQVEPLGLDSKVIRLSWRLRLKDPSTPPHSEPTAYQVVAASTRIAAEALTPDLWNSGLVESDWSPAIDYRGPAPACGEAVHWRARVRDDAGRWSAWGPIARFVQGPRDEHDWPGPWITATPSKPEPWRQAWLWHPEVVAGEPSPGTRFFRSTFVVADSEPVTLIAHADDTLTVWINGTEAARGGSYDAALRGDVTHLLRPGQNVIAVAASNSGTEPNPAGMTLSLTRAAPRGHVIGTADPTWRCNTNAADGWRSAAFDDRDWQLPVTVSAKAEWQAAIATARRTAEPRFRREFTLHTAPTAAMLHVASVGYHRVTVNGVTLDAPPLAPHVSQLAKRARYSTHELTGMLRAGSNTLEIEVGRGWSQFPPYGHDGVPALRVRLDLRTANDPGQTLTTDLDWRWQPGARTLLGNWRFRDYGGERVAPHPNDDSAIAATWLPVSLRPLQVAISANRCAPNRSGEALVARSSTLRADGQQRFDLGRAATGLLNVVAQGPPHGTVRIAVSERETEDTTYGQVSELQLPASGTGEFRGAFNPVAGRYVTVQGAKPMRTSDVRLTPITTDLTTITAFACSDDRLNELHGTAIWTLRNLMAHGYLVDCPHRERFGYGGDAHATGPALLSHFDAGAFVAKWLQDWRDCQHADGSLPNSAPTMLGGGGPAWGGICAILAFSAYVETGDLQILRDNHDMVRRYIAWLDQHVRDGILLPHGDPEWGFLGDWVAPGYGQGKDQRVPAEWTLFFNNCYRLELLTAAARIAHALGEHAEAETHRNAAIAARSAIRARFVRPKDTFWSTARQPYLAIALAVGLVDELHDGAQSRLLAAVHSCAGHVDAGIHGTHYLLDQLTAIDRDDVALTMVGKLEPPGWLHMLEQGATTLWEQWDGEHSRMHASFVSVATWFVRGLAGIRADPAWPGYERFTIAPALGHLRWLTCRHESVRGTIEVAWQREAEQLRCTLQVPPGSRARVLLPIPEAAPCTVDGHLLDATTRVGNRTLLWLGPGRHVVTATL